MKLHEIIYLDSMVSDNTTAIVAQGDTEFILDRDWDVIVEAPDGHAYQLNKDNWTAKDLIDFASRYPLEDDNCTLMFIYPADEDYEDICLIPDEVGVFLHYNDYELQFTVHRPLTPCEGDLI